MLNGPELIPSVKRSPYRVDDPTSEHSDKDFLSLRPGILERDNHTCQCCGFRSKKWQEVHHRNNDHSYNVDSNLVTVCPLCHMVFHIGFTGLKQRARLIFIEPETGITQSDINNVVRALWLYERFESKGSGGIDSLASSLLGRLKQYSIVAHMMLGSSDPSILGEYMLRHMSDEAYENRADHLRGFLLFPNKEAFEKQIDYWHKNEFPSPKSWKPMAASNLKKWSENDLGDDSTKAIMSLLENSN